jgi:hypothetical protein
LKEKLRCTDMAVRELQRGIPDTADELLPHKPAETTPNRSETTWGKEGR